MNNQPHPSVDSVTAFSPDWIAMRMVQEDMVPVGEASILRNVSVDAMKAMLESKKAVGLKMSPNMWLVPRWQFQSAFTGVVERLFAFFPEHYMVLKFLDTPNQELGGKPKDIVEALRAREVITYLNRTKVQ